MPWSPRRLLASTLPPPDSDAARLSRLLTERIFGVLDRAGGWMGFEEYMERVLNEPGLGYYSAGAAKLGPAGDFITGPELGGFLAAALAWQIRETLEVFAAPKIVEIGAGTGRLARDVMTALREFGVDPLYCILERSADFRQRQAAELAAFGSRVTWVDRWPPEPFEGVILANEVLDALPVSSFVKHRDVIFPMGVAKHQERLGWAKGAPQSGLTVAVQELERKLGRPLEDGYRSELRLGLEAWFDAISRPLAAGALLLVDYGLVRRDYYGPERNGGTLMCHYRHRAHADPFFLPGLQDISAWVDFSACADAARTAGLEVVGFTTQAHFLAETVATMPLAKPEVLSAAVARSRSLQKLLLPGEMGERFKVLWLSRGGVSKGLPGRDFRDRL
jgi:SAM-dependent MidA family methyltransferase